MKYELVNHNLSNFRVGQRSMSDDGMWLNRPKVIKRGNELFHKFRCQLDLSFGVRPSTRHVQRILWKPEKVGKYRLRYFYVVTDLTGQLKGVLLDKQFHPHKDRNSGYMCLSNHYSNVKFTDECLVRLVLTCILKYNAEDCYELPNLNDAREIIECQIS